MAHEQPIAEPATIAQRQQALRDRREALGLTRLEVKAYEADKAAIKAFAEKLQARREKAAR